ncbi:MAG: HNH endonuclease [Actinomycetota bacterium]|nr:HNH endonuclease [Actinomycetota bacterium]
MNRWVPLRVRLFSKLVTDPSGCVLWTGYCDRDGYGEISVNGQNQKVHRVVYEMFAEPIPDGLYLDHVKAWGCTHRNCANVGHLEPVTNAENLRRGETLTAINAAKTRCSKKHLYDEANTRINSDGSRACRTCNRDEARLARERKAALRTPDPDPGRLVRGELHGAARLTAEAVLAMRAQFRGDVRAVDLARELGPVYGVHPTTILAALYRRTWKHLADDGELLFGKPLAVSR